MSTFEKIKNIFYSGSYAFTGSLDPINEIAFLVDNDYLFLNETVMFGKKDYLAILDKPIASHADSYRADGGGPAHIALKLLSGKYLKQERQVEVDYEQSFCGYYPDVISKNKLIVVECGHTQNPEKILTYLKQGSIKEFIQVPYPDETDNEIIAYSFKAKKILKDFLVFLETSKNDELKKILNRKRIQN